MQGEEEKKIRQRELEKEELPHFGGGRGSN
jgi:hypothetical protein